MSSTEGNDNNKSTASTRKKATSSTADAKAVDKKETAKKGGLVRAPKNEIMELPDHTRVVESDTLPNNRPISLSEIEVVDSMSSAGRRPIMSNSFEISTTDTLPGHRPIAVDTHDFSNVDMLPGHRPIADNDSGEDPSSLMGYLD